MKEDTEIKETIADFQKLEDRVKCPTCVTFVYPVDQYGFKRCLKEGRYCPGCGYAFDIEQGVR